MIAGVGGNPENLGMVSHKKYFAPRVGFAYRLTSSTVLRSGFGMSYTSFPDNNYAYNFPVRSNNQYLPFNNASYTPSVLPNGQPATFQAGFPAPAAVVVPSSGIITNPDPTSAYFYIPKDFKNPYVLQWNFAIQQALPFHLAMDVAYVGSHGVDTAAQVNLNAGLIVGAAANGQPEKALFGRITSTTQLYQGFSSTYHSLQVKFDRRVGTGLHLTTSFTWQKAMDFMSGDDGGLAQWYINPGRNYARADYDRTLNYVQSYVYQLPFGKGKKFASSGGPVAAIVGGWQVTGILTMRTGSPLTFTDNGGLINAPSNAQTPDQIAPIKILHGINNGNPWFDTSSFGTPATGVFGTMGRAVASGPGQFRIDAGLSRWINIGEKYKVQIKADAINFTNTPFFNNPNTSHTSTGFGFVTGTVGSGVGVNGFSAARSVQLSFKFTF